MFMLIDIIEHAEFTHTQLPNRQDRLKWRHKISQQLSLLGFYGWRISQLRFDGIQNILTVIGAQSFDVRQDPCEKSSSNGRNMHILLPIQFPIVKAR